MKKRLANLGKFGFHFATAVYLLAVPFSIFMLPLARLDGLMPLESGLATSLSIVNGGLAVKHAWRALK